MVVRYCDLRVVSSLRGQNEDLLVVDYHGKQ